MLLTIKLKTSQTGKESDVSKFPIHLFRRTGNNYSVTEKIIAILVIATTIMLGGFGIHEYFSEKSGIILELNTVADRLSNRLAKSLYGPLWDMNTVQIRDILKYEMLSQEKVCVLLLEDTETKEVIHGLKRNDNWQIEETNRNIEGDFIIRVGNIADENEKIANIRVGISKKFMVAELRKLIFSIFLKALIMDVVIVLIPFIFIRKFVVQPLSQVIRGLRDTAEDIDSAAGQIASASQMLAEKCLEQAAYLEETSASLEQIDSMTRQNADYSDHAESVMRESSGDFEKADDSLDMLIQFMEEISAASMKSRKIIKTIDDVAFRTNLLALNAAVEAARAGKAGAGFAVVAGEVRNLAVQSADASKNTAMIVEDIIGKLGDGKELLSSAGSIFSQVKRGGIEFNRLFGEIASASREQSRGVGHINEGVSEMDKAIQQNAASAEELAVASEKMDSHADRMNQFVEKLTALAGCKGETYGK